MAYRLHLGILKVIFGGGKENGWNDVDCHVGS